MNKILTLLLLFITSTAQAYTVADGKYITEHRAVRAFFENNYDILKVLRSNQEMLGWVLVCNGVYKVTKPFIGTATNPVNVNETFRGCYKVSFMHSHPAPMGNLTTDFFSEADLDFTRFYPLYMMAQENCFLRYAELNSERPKGRYLGKVNCPIRKIIRLK